MKPRAAQRLSGFGTSVFTEITRLATAHGAVNLGQGFPDFPAPPFVKDAAARAIAAGHDQYAPAAGVPRLRETIARRFERSHGVATAADDVTIASGATEALFAAILALVDPGDEVIVFEPSYDAYVPAVQMAGGVARPVTLAPPRWELDENALAAAFGPRTKLVVLNTPHNPTGKVWRESELDALARLCVEHDVIALSDEVYSEIVFPGARHVPLCTRPGMRERTITIDSLGKTFSVTGWKVGWAIAAPPLTAAFRAVHQFVTFCTATPLQHAAADALGEAADNGYLPRLRIEYEARREILRGILTDAGLAPLPVDGAYFLLAELGDLPFADDVAFCRFLTTEIGVAAIPPSAFYADPAAAPRLARFCFAKAETTLRAAGERLRAGRERLARGG